MRQKAEEKADEEIRALRRGNNSTPVNEGEDEPTGERFPLQVLEIVQQVPGVAPKDIHLILQHKFEAENLTRLRNDVGTRPREDSQTAEFDPTTRQLTVKRARGSTKDFGDTPLLWIECFTTYTRIIGLLFAAEHPSVLPAMLHFMARVIRHSHAYDWLSVLQFALAWHKQVAATSVLDPTAWQKVPDEWTAYYINPSTVKSVKKAKSTQNVKATAQPNDKSTICDNFNASKGCSADWCHRSHTCKICNSDTHGAVNCRKK